MPNTIVATTLNATRVATEPEPATARMPTAIWRSGPASPPSVTSTGSLRVRTEATSTAENRERRRIGRHRDPRLAKAGG